MNENRAAVHISEGEAMDTNWMFASWASSTGVVACARPKAVASSPIRLSTVGARNAGSMSLGPRPE